jgi:hypothetical protein
MKSMSALQTFLTFTLPTQNTDGTPITKALSATAFIDTVTPPVKSFPVPAANIAAAAAGVVTVTFVELGFTPVAATDYFVDVTVTDADGTSSPSASLQFGYSVVPKAPTSLKVG